MARAILLSFLLYACAGRSHSSAPSNRVAGSGDPALHAALLAGVDAQALDAGTFEAAVGFPEPALRQAAALRAGQAGARALAPRLRALVGDRDTAVAANAALALALLHDSAAVAALAGALGGASGVGTAAAFALGELGEPARASIVAALDSARGRGVVGTTEALLYAAAKLRPVPTEVVRPYLAASQPLRRAAAYAIGRVRMADGVRALAAVGADPDAATRAYVARGLARSATGDSLAGLALPALARLSADADPHVRIAGLRSLGTFGLPARAAVERALRDPDPNVRIAAAEATSLALRQAAGATWRGAWQADSGFGYRRALLAAAPAGALDVELAEWATDGGSHGWARRAAAAAALSGAARERAPRLLALRADRDARVRAGALDALASTLDSAAAPGWLRDTVRGALRDPDAVVRASALAALASAPQVSDLAAVRSAYARSAGDRDNDARLAALRYLAALWRRDSASLSARDRAWLATLAAPADPLERAAGAGLPVAAAWSSVATPPTAVAPYRAVVDSLLLPALAGRLPRVRLHTGRGVIELELLAADAPLTAANFLGLARRGYYRRTSFHRVVGGFVAQDGDPRGDGSGGPGYAIRDENSRHPYRRGAVGMALSGPNTGGSQYFITLAHQPHLDAHYTLFARVVDGMGAADQLVPSDRVDSVTVRE